MTFPAVRMQQVGLDVIEVLSEEVLCLTQRAERLGPTKSTTHRLASALVERGYLAFTPRLGYRLGPRLLHLGHLATLRADIIQVARPHVEDLSTATGDTVHLGIPDGERAVPRQDAGAAAEQRRERMGGYRTAGRAFDFEENQDQFRCVAAPVRDGSGGIVAAISVSSAAQYMSDDRMDEPSGDVRAAARAISLDLGWTVGLPPATRARRRR